MSDIKKEDIAKLISVLGNLGMLKISNKNEVEVKSEKLESFINDYIYNEDLTLEPIDEEDTVDVQKIFGDTDNRGKRIPYKEIVSYLNEKAEKNYNFKSHTTRDKIKARWNEGHTLEDFKLVIDYKVKEWKGYVNGEFHGDKYLRPITLFAPSNFDTYLNEALDHELEKNAEENSSEHEWTGEETSWQEFL